MDPIRQNGLKFEGINYQGKYKGIIIYVDQYVDTNSVVLDRDKKFMIVSPEVYSKLADDRSFSYDPNFNLL